MRDGLVSKEDLEAVLRDQSDSRQQRLSGRRLGELLVARGLVTQAQVAKLVAEQYELPFVEIDVADLDLEVAGLLSEEIARRFSAIPISDRPDGSLLLAIADPATVLFSEELRRVLGAPPRFAVVSHETIEAAIAHVHEREVQPVESFETHAPPSEAAVVELPPLTNDEPYLGSQRTAAHLWPPLGALLIREGLVTDGELETALAQQRLSASRRLGEILVDRGIVDRAEIARLVAEQYELPFVELGDFEADPMTAALLPEDIARRYSAVPTGLLPDGSLRVLVADPTVVLYSDEFHAALGVPLNLAVASPDAVEAAIASLYEEATDVPDAPGSHEFETIDAVGESETARGLEETAEPVALTDLEEETAEPAGLTEHDEETAEPVAFTEHDQEMAEPVALAELVEPPDVFHTDADDGVTEAAEEAAEEPVVDAPVDDSVDGELDLLIERGVALGASSIHFSPQPTGLVVRARIDGVMRDMHTIPTSKQDSVTSRLKAIAHSPANERIVDLRAEAVSTKRGDKVTLRVHGGIAALTSFAELGMASDAAETVLKAIHQPFGAIVVCGPTGSGRTTTLYAALHELNTPERTLTTIEDPIEHLTPGIDQVEVDPEAGLTFAQGLSTILRTDSDVVLVGDIPDSDTAEIAVRAAMTDSLVLAGLQAPTAVAGIRRLLELGIEPGLLAATLTCVVAQRLVRRLCSDCRETYYATEVDLVELGRPAIGEGPRLLARSRGCGTCDDTGYSGRVGLFEVLPLTGDVNSLVAKAASPPKIERAALAAGMRTVREEAIRLCLDGVTTPAEVRRVTGDWTH
jgi:type IV pilus assembly protein PilB